jgi:ATP-dependent exoDNAse (exonuclease V) beta subunit
LFAGRDPYGDGQALQREGGAMIDMVFEAFRKASESTMQMPLEIYRGWTQQMLSSHPMATGMSFDWTRALQRRWSELVVETLHKHRESLDAAYRSGIQLIEQTFRVSDAKSSEEVRRMSEELWRKLLDVLKQQSESQVRDFQNWAARSIDIQRASA